MRRTLKKNMYKKRTVKGKRKSKRRRHRGGKIYDNPLLNFPHAVTYKDITDNFTYLEELPNPNLSLSYKINNIYVIKSVTHGKDRGYYYKFIIENITTDNLTVIPVLAKGATYAKGSNHPYDMPLDDIQYAYRLLDKGTVSFAEVSDDMQLPYSTLRSTILPVDKVIGYKPLTDSILSYAR